MSKSKKGRVKKPVQKTVNPAVAKEPQDILVNNVQIQNFEYKLNAVTLAFSLRIDVENELKDFGSLMVKATEDIRRMVEERFGPKESKSHE